MAQAGRLEANGLSYPKMRIRTVEVILDGELFDTPGMRGPPSFLYNMDEFAELNQPTE